MDSISDFLSRLLSPETGDPTSLGAMQVLGAIAVAYAGGVLSSLTPCVYPMIPITVGVVGGGAHRNWRSIVLRGFSYVAGMALIYSFLGVLAGLTGRVFGTLTNSSGWYLGLGLVISVSALIMMDVIPFDPVALKDKLASMTRRKGHTPAAVQAHERSEMTMLGAFVLGATSGFIASPCTTPVLTSILAYIAKTQSIGLGLALMLSFSAGLGTLLLTVAAFTGALQILPRSGKWMKTVKLVSGLLLLGFGEYLIYRAGALGGP